MSILILFNWSLSGDLLYPPQLKCTLHYQVSQVAYRTDKIIVVLVDWAENTKFHTYLPHCISGHSLHWWGEKRFFFFFFLSKFRIKPVRHFRTISSVSSLYFDFFCLVGQKQFCWVGGFFNLFPAQRTSRRCMTSPQRFSVYLCDIVWRLREIQYFALPLRNKCLKPNVSGLPSFALKLLLKGTSNSPTVKGLRWPGIIALIYKNTPAWLVPLLGRACWFVCVFFTSCSYSVCCVCQVTGVGVYWNHRVRISHRLYGHSACGQTV